MPVYQRNMLGSKPSKSPFSNDALPMRGTRNKKKYMNGYAEKGCRLVVRRRMAIGRYVQHDFIRANLRIHPRVQAVYSSCFSSVVYPEAHLKEVIRCTYGDEYYVNVRSKLGAANSKGGA